jgi:protein gp37
MSDGTRIAWTEATWNIVTGCTRCSSGCLNCYIASTPPFRMVGRRFDHDGIGGTTGVILHSDRLGIPQRWRKPRRIFVCSLADLFHDDVPPSFIADAFAVMSICPQHTFQVLTKRHGRLKTLLTSNAFWLLVNRAREIRGHGDLPGIGPRVLPNVWIGVSCEDQAAANLRIPALLDTPAMVRWVSAEPLLGPIDMDRADRDVLHDGGIDWVVIGGESGAKARPCRVEWIRSLVGQCADSVHTKPFVKQLGSVLAQSTLIDGKSIYRSDPKGGKSEHMPADLRVREYPHVEAVASC